MGRIHFVGNKPGDFVFLGFLSLTWNFLIFVCSTGEISLVLSIVKFTVDFLFSILDYDTVVLSRKEKNIYISWKFPYSNT